MEHTITKAELRKRLRAARKAHVLAQPDIVRGLLFHRPPAPLMASIPAGAVIGLYHASEFEAPASGYARIFAERGHPLALPRFTGANTAMQFCAFTDPFAETDLEEGPFGIMQPTGEPGELVPDIVFAPLIGFTASGTRLGQGGGHYDRWLTEHPGTRTVGLAWDVQLVEPDSALPTEPHDVALDCIVTPTRMYGNL